MRVIHCLPVLLVIAGCANQEQIASRQPAKQAASTHKSTEQAAITDDARCRQDRGTPGSIAYVACRMKLASNRHDDGTQEANPSR